MAAFTAAGGYRVGWFGVGVAMFAIPVGKATGLDINLLIAVSGLLMTVTVFFGISALTVLSVIAVPAIACLGGYSVWLAVNGMGGFGRIKSGRSCTTARFQCRAGAGCGVIYQRGYAHR